MSDISKHVDQFISDMGMDGYEDIGFLYQDYIDECSDIVKSLDDDINTSTVVALEKMIHNLKGVSANLYVQPVYDITNKLNDYMKDHMELDHADETILSLWAETKSTFSTTITDLISHFKNNGVSLNH